MPESGIIVCAACNLPLFFRPGRRQFVVCCVADSPPRFYTPCQVFQSNRQAIREQSSRPFPYVTHVPHWPQPGLLPRSPERGVEFRHIDYFGARDQLAPELQSPAFAQRLRRLGLELRLHFDHYHDYRSTDAVLAVRNFGPVVVGHKPASKLINAWIAGVPSVLGPENAFRELRRSPLDYLEAGNAEECVAALERLSNDRRLRAAMAEQGRARTMEFAVDVLTERWRVLLSELLPPYCERWGSLSWAARQRFFAEQALRRCLASAARRIRRPLQSQL